MGSGPRDRDSEGVTARQRQYLRFVATFTAANGYPPTVREMASAHGVTPNAVSDALDALERKGKIRRTPRTARSIVVQHG